MIHAVTIDNVSNTREQTIDLDRLTVCFGATGNGKTSVLEASDLAVPAEPGNPGWLYLQDQEIGWISTRGGSGDIAIACETGGGPSRSRLPPPEPSDAQRWEFHLKATDGSSIENAQGSARPLTFLHEKRLAKPLYFDSHSRT